MLINFFVFLFGLIIGSFLNMLIYRIAENVSLFNPKRSICPNCKYTIKWYENIPLVSYIFLKASCSNCKEKISILYPIIELLTAFFTLLLVIKFGINSNAVLYLFLFYTLIVLSFIDFKYKTVPDYLLLLALFISVFVDSFSFINAFIFAGAFSLLNFIITFYIQNIKSKLTKNDDLLSQEALGEGDIPIVAIIGGILGIKLGLIAIFLSAIFAIIPSIYNKIKNNEIETAFIPFLVLGFFTALVFSHVLNLEGLIR